MRISIRNNYSRLRTSEMDKAALDLAAGKYSKGARHCAKAWRHAQAVLLLP